MFRQPASVSARSVRWHVDRWAPAPTLITVVIYEPHALTDQQLNELANKLWYPIWDSGLDLDQSVRTVAQCEAVTDRDLPAAMGWLDVVPIAGTLDLSKAQPYPYWNDGARPHANVCRNCSAPPNRASTNSAAWPTSTSRTSGGTRWPARLRIGVRARRILACRPSARHV